jgi:hypothetical protein
MWLGRTASLTLPDRAVEEHVATCAADVLARKLVADGMAPWAPGGFTTLPQVERLFVRHMTRAEYGLDRLGELGGTVRAQAWSPIWVRLLWQACESRAIRDRWVAYFAERATERDVIVALWRLDGVAAVREHLFTAIGRIAS